MLTQTPWSSRVTADVRESLQAVLASAVVYVETRWQIARLESKEALRVGAGVVVLVFVIALSITVAYLGIIMAGTWWISQNWGDGGLLWPVSLVIGAHLMLAAFCAWWAARAVRRGRLFYVTRKELMEDKLWLQTNQESRN